MTDDRPYCRDWERDEHGSPLCYQPAVAEADFGDEDADEEWNGWQPVCGEHAAQYPRTRPLRS